MNWSEYGPAVLAAFLGVTLTDAIFSGLLMRRSNRPGHDIWRSPIMNRPVLAFGLSRIWAALTCSSYLFFCGFFGLTSVQPAVMFAASLWLAVALPLIANAAMYLRLRPALVFAQSAGWLVKLLVCAAAADYFL